MFYSILYCIYASIMLPTLDAYGAKSENTPWSSLESIEGHMPFTLTLTPKSKQISKQQYL